MERRGIHNVVGAYLRTIHGKAIMVLRRNHDVLHARVLGDADPLVSVKFCGIKLFGELLVFRHRDLGAIHDPFADARDGLALPLPGWYGVQPPMNEHSKTGLAPPIEPRIGRFLGLFCRLLRGCTLFFCRCGLPPEGSSRNHDQQDLQNESSHMIFAGAAHLCCGLGRTSVVR